eukprot:PhF_6_TR13917/c0_g1_i1/m.22375
MRLVVFDLNATHRYIDIPNDKVTFATLLRQVAPEVDGDHTVTLLFSYRWCASQRVWKKYQVHDDADAQFVLEGDGISRADEGIVAALDKTCASHATGFISLGGPPTSGKGSIRMSQCHETNVSRPPALVPEDEAKAYPYPPSSAPSIDLSLLLGAPTSPELNSDVVSYLQEAILQGHCYVDLPPELYHTMKKSHVLSQRLFDASPTQGKSCMSMDPDDRVWGWHVMGWKRKEIFKLRDVPDAAANWPRDSAVPALDEFRVVIHAFRTVGIAVTKAMFRYLDVTAPPQFFSEDPHPTRDDYSASFYESFRYAAFPDLAPQIAVPCETHNDVGVVTVSLRAEGCRGLQVFSYREGVWVDAEAPMDAAPHRIVIFFGDFMDYITRGKCMMSPHRVVMDPSATAPRLSTIYEVLPHPQSVVPRVKDP